MALTKPLSISLVFWLLKQLFNYQLIYKQKAGKLHPLRTVALWLNKIQMPNCSTCFWLLSFLLEGNLTGLNHNSTPAGKNPFLFRKPEKKRIYLSKESTWNKTV